MFMLLTVKPVVTGKMRELIPEADLPDLSERAVWVNLTQATLIQFNEGNVRIVVSDGMKALTLEVTDSKQIKRVEAWLKHQATSPIEAIAQVIAESAARDNDLPTS